MNTKIAIVEDDFLLALVMRRHLEKEGFECYSFSNATDFFSYINDSPKLKVVILDVKIKGLMNGLELFNKLSGFSDVPVIFSTGNSDLLELQSLKKSQVKGILIKPINLEELSGIIHKID